MPNSRIGPSVRITPAPLDLGSAVAAVSDPSCGAVVTFTGSVRESEGGSAIEAIVYEAHEGFAEKELTRILEEASARFGARCEATHRVGRVVVGEAGLIIACAAPHRAEAFDAARYILEEIKRRLPAWKVAFE